MRQFLFGKKTYIVVLGLIATILGSWLSGDVVSLGTLLTMDNIQMLLGALGLGTLRAGVAKI